MPCTRAKRLYLHISVRYNVSRTFCTLKHFSIASCWNFIYELHFGCSLLFSSKNALGYLNSWKNCFDVNIHKHGIVRARKRLTIEFVARSVYFLVHSWTSHNYNYLLFGYWNHGNEIMKDTLPVLLLISCMLQ